MCFRLNDECPVVIHPHADAYPVALIVVAVYLIPLISSRRISTAVLVAGLCIQFSLLHNAHFSHWGLGPVAVMLAWNSLLRQRSRESQENPLRGLSPAPN